jgi:hypothetical protein
MTELRSRIETDPGSPPFVFSKETPFDVARDRLRSQRKSLLPRRARSLRKNSFFYTFKLRAPFGVAQDMLRDLCGEISVSTLAAASPRWAL